MFQAFGPSPPLENLAIKNSLPLWTICGKEKGQGNGLAAHVDMLKVKIGVANTPIMSLLLFLYWI